MAVRFSDNFRLTRCKHFEKATIIDPKIEFLYVKCNKQNNRKLVYSNVHFLLPERKRLRKNLDRVKGDEKQKRISVLVLGIDSISRINFYRMMPQTAKYVNEMGWFELYGYNKVGINTFPNVLAMLAGISIEYKGDNGTIKPDDPETKCDPHDFFDSCPFIWKNFRKAGYVTAYGEDKPEYSTFNYEKKGFQHSPTDYYLRPFLVAAKSLLKVRHPNIAMHCVGFMNEAELVYDYGLEFIEHHRDDPYFGIFWVNSFSHNYFHTPQAMDTKILDYLQQFGQKGVFNKSIVLFLSDHGIRFGPYRRSNQAYIEERLPFFFIWLPPWLKAQHPELEDALTINKHRLATPLDVHQTLKHIMILSGESEHLDSATVEDEGSQTLFKPLPPNRSCRDARIPDFYCACRDLIVSVEVPTEDLETFVQLIQKSEKIQVEAVTKVNQITLDSETDDEGAELYILTVKDKKYDYEAAIRKEYSTNRTVLEYFYLISCLTCKSE
ncbi:uncharacterized protein LOC119648621 [Hermetia illucens]|uniref:uncharacterized protein LOC119648621 n=1 Tax=Hermetia illucens TaxID=343691 RepID=UPI0018CC7A76|nr:uncharacterized protein LOC119648621 [Hermetia illucens]